MLSISLIIAAPVGVTAQPWPDDPIEAHELRMVQAIRAKDIGAVRALLRTPYIDLNTPIRSRRISDKGRTFINVAAFSCETPAAVSVAKLLLDAGADPNILYISPTGRRQGTLAYAASQHCIAFVKELLEHNADANQTSHSSGLGDVTPLLSIVSGGMGSNPGAEDVVRLLLLAGANPSFQESDKFGKRYSPISRALVSGDRDFRIAKELLNPAIPTPVDPNNKLNGWTAMDLFQSGLCKPFTGQSRVQILKMMRHLGIQRSDKALPNNCWGFFSP